MPPFLAHHKLAASMNMPDFKPETLTFQNDCDTFRLNMAFDPFSGWVSNMRIFFQLDGRGISLP